MCVLWTSQKRDRRWFSSSRDPSTYIYCVHKLTLKLKNTSETSSTVCFVCVLSSLSVVLTGFGGLLWETNHCRPGAVSAGSSYNNTHPYTHKNTHTESQPKQSALCENLQVMPFKYSLAETIVGGCESDL